MEMSLTGDYGSGWKAAQCDVLKTCELRYFTKDISSDELLVDGCLVFSRSDGEAVAPVATCKFENYCFNNHLYWFIGLSLYWFYGCIIVFSFCIGIVIYHTLFFNRYNQT